MERPLCPLCKTNHFAREPHKFKRDVSCDIREGAPNGEAADSRSNGGSIPSVPIPTPTPTLGGLSPEVVATPSNAQRVSVHVNEPVVDRIEPVRNAQHETAGKPKFDRVAYQREYMRKRRAKVRP